MQEQWNSGPLPALHPWDVKVGDTRCREEVKGVQGADSGAGFAGERWLEVRHRPDHVQERTSKFSL